MFFRVMCSLSQELSYRQRQRTTLLLSLLKFYAIFNINSLIYNSRMTNQHYARTYAGSSWPPQTGIEQGTPGVVYIQPGRIINDIQWTHPCHMVHLFISRDVSLNQESRTISGVCVRYLLSDSLGFNVVFNNS